MLKIKKILFATLIFVSGVSPGQRIQNFYLVQTNGQVGVRFTFTKGSQCAGYTIHWSADSINYSPVYNYAGTCGDFNSDQDFSYTHLGPFPNQLNYYKVEMTLTETSPPKSIFVGAQVKNRMLIYPDPLTNYNDKTSFRVYNANNVRLIGFLYNQFGKPIRNIDLTTKGEFGDIYSNDLENGLYVLWLTDGNVAYSGKFIVLR